MEITTKLISVTWSSPFLTNNFSWIQTKLTRHPYLNLLRLYHAQLRRWFESTTSREMEIFKKHNFGNACCLLKVEINWWFIEILVANWDLVSWVFQFDSIDLYPMIEEYS